MLSWSLLHGSYRVAPTTFLDWKLEIKEPGKNLESFCFVLFFSLIILGMVFGFNPIPFKLSIWTQLLFLCKYKPSGSLKIQSEASNTFSEIGLREMNV